MKNTKTTKLKQNELQDIQGGSIGDYLLEAAISYVTGKIMGAIPNGSPQA